MKRSPLVHERVFDGEFAEEYARKLGMFAKTLKSALTAEEAGALIRRSNLREGAFSSDLLWWRYEA